MSDRLEELGNTSHICTGFDDCVHCWAVNEIVNLRQLLKRLQDFRWNYKGYGQLSCRSCGGRGEEEYDPPQIISTDCSNTCPFELTDRYFRERDLL